MIYTLRVTAGQEKILSQMLYKKARAEKLDIYSIVYVENVKGYLFVEGVDENTVIKLINKVKHVKEVLKKAILIAEIENLIKADKPQGISLQNGDIVEMSSGPFKGERARVINVDEAKDELTVELMEVAVPIPVTVKTKMIKLITKSEDVER